MPPPIQTAPITVALIAIVDAARASEIAFRTNARTKVVKSPPTAQPIPLTSAPTSARIAPTYPAGASGASGRASSQYSWSATRLATSASANTHQPPS